MPEYDAPIDENRMPVTCGIQNSLPKRWEDFAGNGAVIRYLRDGLLRRVLTSDNRSGNIFITGPSRSGKTALVKHFARCVTCEQLDQEALNPCNGSCRVCSENDVSRFGLRGLEVSLVDGKRHFLPINCARITHSELEEQLTELRDYDGTRIVYLDEVHRLARRGMDEMLLKPLEERNFLWLASSALTSPLEPMFLKRFIIKRTTLPSLEELTNWLLDRCVEFGLTWDESHTLIRLAERADRITGDALKVLAEAGDMPERRLTRQLVEDFIFVPAYGDT